MTSSPFDTGVLGGRPCPRADERLTALADGELPPHDADRVLAHVAGCPDCRAVLDASDQQGAARGPPHAQARPDAHDRLLEIPRTSFLAPVPFPVARQRKAPRRLATLSMAASRRRWSPWCPLVPRRFLGRGSGPSVVPATPVLYQEHVATTAQMQLLPEALPLTPFVQSVSNR